MKKQTLLLLLSLWLGHSYAQEKQKEINTDGLSDEQLLKLGDNVVTDGWVHVIHEGKHYVSNFSNPEYNLRVQLNCADENPPSYLIEYTDKYRDGNYGGIDFLRIDDPRKVSFLVDGTNFENPFRLSAYTPAKFATFVEALKKGKLLTVDVHNNRKITFKLANPEFLDIAVECPPRIVDPEEVQDEEMEEAVEVVEEAATSIL